MSKTFPKSLLIISVLFYLILLGIMFNPPQQVLAAPNLDDPELTDHSEFEELQQDFQSGPEVTAACLECHRKTAQEVHQTTHWTWEYTSETGQELGKNNVINNYCVAVESNWPRCTSCHVGYGYKNAEFDFTNETAVDCLVCHETTGTYKKFPTAAGHPVYEETVFSGKTWAPPDLAAVAQSVSLPTRENCGVCHFYGGGGPGVKHGDLDPTMANPSYELDVHLSPDGGDFTCQTCHVTEDHAIAGTRYDMNVTNTEDNLNTCLDCHEEELHADLEYTEELNDHIDRVACQTCHIPAMAREYPTMTWWDWSQAGLKNDEGAPYSIKNDNGIETYNSKKGEFVWESNVTPEYYWFDGYSEYITLQDKVDPNSINNINTLQGDINNTDARIFPVKAFYAIQPYDAGNQIIAVPHLMPTSPDDDSAYWKKWDWDKALNAGLASAGIEYSGEYGWLETAMYWPLTHMVAPAEDALNCESCHTTENSRLDFASLGYDENQVAILTTFPPQEPEVIEPTVEKPTAPPAAEESTDDTEEVAVSESSSSVTIWAVVIGVVLIIGVVLQIKKKD